MTGNKQNSKHQGVRQDLSELVIKLLSGKPPSVDETVGQWYWRVCSNYQSITLVSLFGKEDSTNSHTCSQCTFQWRCQGHGHFFSGHVEGSTQYDVNTN